MEFGKQRAQLKSPCVIYCDLETINEKLRTCEPDPEKLFVHKKTLQTPCGFSYAVVGPSGVFVDFEIYRGRDAIPVLLQHLKEQERRIKFVKKSVVPMTL